MQGPVHITSGGSTCCRTNGIALRASCAAQRLGVRSHRRGAASGSSLSSQRLQKWSTMHRECSGERTTSHWPRGAAGRPHFKRTGSDKPASHSRAPDRSPAMADNRGRPPSGLGNCGASSEPPGLAAAPCALHLPPVCPVSHGDAACRSLEPQAAPRRFWRWRTAGVARRRAAPKRRSRARSTSSCAAAPALHPPAPRQCAPLAASSRASSEQRRRRRRATMRWVPPCSARPSARACRLPARRPRVSLWAAGMVLREEFCSLSAPRSLHCCLARARAARHTLERPSRNAAGALRLGYGGLPLASARTGRDPTCTSLTTSYKDKERLREAALRAEEQRRSGGGGGGARGGGGLLGYSGGGGRALARLPAGMRNLGNTCYLNAVLQVRPVCQRVQGRARSEPQSLLPLPRPLACRRLPPRLPQPPLLLAPHGPPRPQVLLSLPCFTADLRRGRQALEGGRGGAPLPAEGVYSALLDCAAARDSLAWWVQAGRVWAGAVGASLLHQRQHVQAAAALPSATLAQHPPRVALPTPPSSQQGPAPHHARQPEARAGRGVGRLPGRLPAGALVPRPGAVCAAGMGWERALVGRGVGGPPGRPPAGEPPASGLRAAVGHGRLQLLLPHGACVKAPPPLRAPQPAGRARAAVLAAGPSAERGAGAGGESMRQGGAGQSQTCAAWTSIPPRRAPIPANAAPSLPRPPARLPAWAAARCASPRPSTPRPATLASR